MSVFSNGLARPNGLASPLALSVRVPDRGGVLAPITRQLAEEDQRCKTQQWSYNAKYDSFESLSFIRSMVQPSFAPNFRQFLKRFPVVDKKAAEHDDRLTDLKSACRGAFEAVRSAPNFEAALQDVSARRRLRR